MVTTVFSDPQVVWDGVARGYIPPDELRVDPSLRLSREADDDIDPITFEVIRNALLYANFEHGQLIQKLCVSPVTVLAKDFQASVLSEEGELVFLGPNLQYFSNCHALTVKWILENRSDNPGIGEGDMFLSNDPYIGAPHQPDTTLTAPVFWEGELICWVANTIHLTDVGGTTPGSFCVDAQDMYDDPAALPPIKLVENGRLRADVEEAFIRHSRLPLTVRMDLRASISGNEATRTKILKLISRYGVAAVKGTMYRVLGGSEAAFVERLRGIPDGTWSAHMYTEASHTLDRGIYRYQLNLRKEGDTLTFDNEGTDPQAGSINCTYAGLAGGTLASLTAILASDLAGAYGGVYRRVRFEPVPGTLSCADFPAAVSPAGNITIEIIMSLAATVVDKMVGCADDKVRKLLLGPSMPQFAVAIWSGTRTDGSYYVALDTNGMIGAISAMSWRDGIDCGGHYWIPDGTSANTEDYERQYPVLYLYRRVLPGSVEGAGTFRGGLGVVQATTPWGSDGVEMSLYQNESFVKQIGMAGANPIGRGSFRWIRDTDLRRRFAEGSVPGGLDELSGTEEEVPYKGLALNIGPEDVWEWTSPTAVGYGDPLLREPALMQADLDSGLFDPTTLEAVYGAVVRDGRIAAEPTEERRRKLFASRLEPAAQGQAAAGVPPRGNTIARIGELVDLIEGNQGRWHRCRRCGQGLGPGAENYKTACTIVERPITELPSEFYSHDVEMSADLVFREVLCPGCGVRFDTEITRVGDALLWDVRLA